MGVKEPFDKRASAIPCIGNGLQNFNPGCHPVPHIFHLRGKGEIAVQPYPEVLMPGSPLDLQHSRRKWLTRSPLPKDHGARLLGVQLKAKLITSPLQYTQTIAGLVDVEAACGDKRNVVCVYEEVRAVGQLGIREGLNEDVEQSRAQYAALGSAMAVDVEVGGVPLENHVGLSSCEEVVEEYQQSPSDFFSGQER